MIRKRRTPSPGAFALCCAAIATALMGQPAAAWTPESQVAIAERAAIISPADLRRQIARHQDEFRAGVLEPFSATSEARHVKNEDGSGDLDRWIAQEADTAVEEIRSHQAFAKVVYRLGRLAHFVADANNPLAVSGSDPEEEKYAADYVRYLGSAWPRFRVVFYGAGRDVTDPDDVRGLLGRSFERGRRLYPSLHSEYRRIGAPRGVELFDDRSAAFGVGSLAFSHAVSDTAALLRYIWLRAGGVDARQLPISRGPTSGVGLTARP